LPGLADGELVLGVAAVGQSAGPLFDTGNLTSLVEEVCHLLLQLTALFGFCRALNHLGIVPENWTKSNRQCAVPDLLFVIRALKPWRMAPGQVMWLTPADLGR
jgi:hypothetical protein